MKQTIELDLVILGGGIAGLWTLHRALQAGYNAILLEKNTLGGGQTVCSQGIIHGGIKYALNGVLSAASNTIKEMPAIWRDCLAGRGQIDLSGTHILSDAHYMWSKKTLGAKLTTFFASKALSGRVAAVPVNERPEVFQSDSFKGTLYKLNELVLDVPDLIERLAQPVMDRIFQAGPEEYSLQKDSENRLEILFPSAAVTLKTRHIVSTSGEGFDALGQHLTDLQLPAMQRRPLHMVMVKHASKLPLYAHCFSGGSRPVITVTTHYTQQGETVWYLGGELAETGVGRDPTSQIEAARQVLSTLLPWVNLQSPLWQTVAINRAEPKQSTLTLPDAAYAHKVSNLIVAWPTKLALAPDLANKVMNMLPDPRGGQAPALDFLAKPPVTCALWERGSWQ